MGGDHAPDEIVRGALLYREKGGMSDLVLVGREDAIRKALGSETPPGITIRGAQDVVGMDEHPQPHPGRPRVPRTVARTRWASKAKRTAVCPPATLAPPW